MISAIFLNLCRCCSFVGDWWSRRSCTNLVSPTCCIVEGELGYCSCPGHRPGEGVLSTTRRYIEKGDWRADFKVASPETNKLKEIKQQACDKLRKRIHSAIPKLVDRDISARDGVLYCYRNTKDPLPPDLKLKQRPLKCGKATNLSRRYDQQERKYERNGETICLVSCQRVPFVDYLDSYMKDRLKWYKLPSRGGDGGTEWYHVSLQEVWDIWNDGRAYALDIAKRAGLQLNEKWYYERETPPVEQQVEEGPRRSARLALLP